MQRLVLADELKPYWQDIIQRELSLTLAHLEADGLTAHVTFGEVAHGAFRCSVEVLHKQTVRAQALVEHTNGRDAIRNALARAKRELTRWRTRRRALKRTAFVVHSP